MSQFLTLVGWVAIAIAALLAVVPTADNVMFHPELTQAQVFLKHWRLIACVFCLVIGGGLALRAIEK